MGFIEESGAAQHFRDARIPPIYEGTNGIQAADLVTRKLAMDDGGAFAALMGEIARDYGDAPTLAALAEDCGAIGQWMLKDASIDDRLAGSVPFCTMCAVAVAGWQLLRQLRTVPQASSKSVTVRFFIERIVPEAAGLKASATAGADLLYALDADALGG
jgi:hypothetical protein